MSDVILVSQPDGSGGVMKPDCLASSGCDDLDNASSVVVVISDWTWNLDSAGGCCPHCAEPSAGCGVDEMGDPKDCHSSEWFGTGSSTDYSPMTLTPNGDGTWGATSIDFDLKFYSDTACGEDETDITTNHLTFLLSCDPDTGKYTITVTIFGGVAILLSATADHLDGPWTVDGSFNPASVSVSHT